MNRDDRFDALERFTPLFEAPEFSLERLLHLRDRKRRSQRIVAGVTGTAVFVAFVSLLAVVGSSGGVRTDPAASGQTGALANEADRDSAPGDPPAENGLIAFSGTSAESNAESDTEIYVVAPDGTGLRALTSTPGVSEMAPAWSPDGTRLAFLRNARTGGGELVVIDPATGGETFSAEIPNLFNGDVGPPEWSPDGRLIVLNVANRLVPQVVDLETKTWTEIGAFFLGWSPDGRWVVLRTTGASGAWSDGQLLLVPADLLGTTDLDDVSNLPGVRPLPLQPGEGRLGVTWMPDSSAVAISFPDSSTDVVTIADGQRRTLIEDGIFPSWSPDASHIAYLRCLDVHPGVEVPVDTSGDDSSQPGESVWVAAADDVTGARAVATSLVPPIWSPGGSLLLAVGDDGLFTIRPDGTGMTRLTQGMIPEKEGAKSWKDPSCTGLIPGEGFFRPAWQPMPRSAEAGAEVANTDATETTPSATTTEAIATDAVDTTASVTTEASATTDG
jgi:hypothetical protein